MKFNEDLIHIAAEVAEAQQAHRPVVALESTVIAHGLPYPDNVATALEMEEAVRAQGAVPATLAVLDGRLRIGLTPAEIERLGCGREPVAKLSRRNLAVAVAQGGLGATTVAATIIGAWAAGIQVMATGGIGGVHRGAPQTFDISADLAELARYPVMVVCAGAKSILDLPLTRELLETLGVPVLGYGTDEFPAFYSRTSGLAVDGRVDTPEDVVRVIEAKWDLDLGGGVLVVNPVPEADALDAAVIAAAVERAQAEAETRGIRGKDLTPFLLARVAALTGGASLAANRSLLRHNARLAGRLAVALNSLFDEEDDR
ncbi:MAG: pseudouridine-5'-phosphate glycosidase [Acidobacteria bacterium]|nr:pseudouridine-5'-phosphate glycosidase [Acidobacteriota bacterium]